MSGPPALNYPSHTIDRSTQPANLGGGIHTFSGHAPRRGPRMVTMENIELRGTAYVSNLAT